MLKKKKTLKKMEMERQATDLEKILAQHLIKDVYPEYINKY